MKLNDPRKAITDATSLHLKTPGNESAAMYGCKIDKSRASTADNLIMDAVEAGRILQAVDRQSLGIRKWLHYAYSATPTNEDMYLATLIFNELFARERKIKWDRLKKLCLIAIEDYRIRTVNCRKLPDEHISTVLGIDRKSLTRDKYKDKIFRVQRILAEYDAKGLAVVRGVIDELNGKYK